MRKLPRLLAGAGVMSAIASGCGGRSATPEVQPSVQATVGGATQIQCEGAPRDGVALDPQAQACADNGFGIGADQFAFPNWGGQGTLDATGMVAMFGPDAVCAKQSDGECTLIPAAAAWLDQVNQAMAGGRCEGMAVVDARLQDGGESVAALQNGADATVDLLQETVPVVDEIEYWWATQMVAEVAEPTAEVLAKQPSEVVAVLVDGLKAGAGYTLGMYTEDAAHAVTPFAVSRSSDGTYDIAIYDNNDPTIISHVIVDPVAQTWTYDQGAINPGEQATVWAGTGPGTLDLTAMDLRSGPFAAPFGDPESEAAKGEVTRTFLITAGLAPGEGSVGAKITAGGVTVDTTTSMEGVQGLPAGVVVTPIKAQTSGQGTVVGVQVSAPSGVGELSVLPVVRPSDRSESTGATNRRVPTSVSVDAPGQPRVTVSARVQPSTSRSRVRRARRRTSPSKGRLRVESRSWLPS